MWLKLLRSLYLAARRVLLGTGISFIPPFSWIKKAALRGLRSSGRVPVLGSWMRRDPGDRLNLAVNGVYEPIDTAFVGRVVQPGDTVVDVGANIGYYTCYLARLVGPKGHVLAFEPAPDLIDILRDNVAFNGYENVQVLNQAVTETTGPLTLYMETGRPEDNRIFKDEQDSAIRANMWWRAPAWMIVPFCASIHRYSLKWTSRVRKSMRSGGCAACCRNRRGCACCWNIGPMA